MVRISKRVRILGNILLLLIFACIGIGYILNLSFASLPDSLKPGNCLYKSGDSISPQWFKDYAGVEVPPGARDISASCASYQDYVAYARFTIDPNDLDRLIKSSLIKLPLSSTEKTFRYGGSSL